MPATATLYVPGDNRHLLGGGAIASFEAALREIVGMRYAVCVANGTVGLLGAAMAMQLAGREIVVPALAHPASVAGLLHLGARLRVADVEADTLTLDPAAARSVITSRTAGVLAVDLFGVPSNTTAIREVADEHGLVYLADTAQALCATREGTHASAYADGAVLSFTTGKALDVGEGGAIVTNRRDIYERVVWHTQHPYRQRRDLGLHLVNPFGINMRMHPATAHSATRALTGLQARIATHLTTVARVRHIIEAAGAGICVPGSDVAIRPSYFRLPVRLTSPIADVVAALRAEGIGASVDPEPPMPFYRHPVFRSEYRRQLSVPRACDVAERTHRDVTTVRIHTTDSKPKHAEKHSVSVSRRYSACTSTV
jgi:dTDP-4-amino-4,6-dideoxygalactose transaminase